ncbi:hypothetical protein IGI04_036137 [Brassica rapa subsp. trilocularis]|uniref:Uncharacterized protein n=1 Tax=Brassica rapa subsp. trilocularis TaxID=1813537 RepID=A0ABQ7LDL8_BRACM|nr:hypothetical protein IGI04_036137 [Brassica rapa subsp. trilocularis]
MRLGGCYIRDAIQWIRFCGCKFILTLQAKSDSMRANSATLRRTMGEEDNQNNGMDQLLLDALTTRMITLMDQRLENFRAEEFNRETSFYRFSTQPEHAANWFHTKKSNGLGDMPVTSQTIYTTSELVLIKESNSLLKECATQTHVWKPGDYSLHLRAVGEFLPCTSSHMIKMNPLFVNLPYMDAFTLGVIEDQRLFPLLFRHDLETIQTSKAIPRMHFFLPKLTRYKERRKLPYMDRFCTNLVQRLDTSVGLCLCVDSHRLRLLNTFIFFLRYLILNLVDMATEEEADEYNISEVDWGEEPGYSWEDQNYGDGSEEEADEYNISEVDWGEEPGYSWEDQNYGDGSEEDDQCRESRAEDGYEEGPCRGELDSKPQDHYKNHTINKSYSKPWLKFTDKFYDYRNENYSRWEEDMENYFWEYKVPEHKKLSIALDTLVGEAYQWWLQEEECRIYFKEPTPHWEYVKELMYEHFEMRRLPPRTCPKRFVKLKPRQLHEREVTLTSHYNSYDQFRLYKFSGKGEDPRNYLQWEEDMERYFKCNSIPKGEYLSYGLGQLTDKAQRYWKREEKYREQFQEPPIRTWEQFKGVMRDRFAPYIPTQHAQKVSTKRVVQPQVLQPANQRQSSKPFDDLINLIKAGSNSVSSNSMTVLTHLSSAQKVKNISGTNMEIKEQEPNLAAQASSTLENSQVPTNDKVISELNVTYRNYQNTGMMHLYSVQNVYKGLGNEETRPEAQQQENNEQSILETSTPADHALEVANTEAESMQDNQVSEALNFTQYYFFESSTSSMKHLLLPISDDSDIGTMEKHPEPNSQPYTQAVVNGETNCEIGDFEKETTILPREIIDRPWKGGIASLLIKEEPPEFNRETIFYRFSTQPEHAANWFHTKKSNGLGDMPVTSQTIYTTSELVLIKESNSLLKECATQTHVWKPGDYSLYLRAVGEFLPCTSSHMIKMNPLFVNLPYMDAFTLGVIKDQRLFPLLFRHDLETIQTSKEIPRMHFFLPKLTRYKERRKLPYMDRFCTNLVQRLVSVFVWIHIGAGFWSYQRDISATLCGDNRPIQA